MVSGPADSRPPTLLLLGNDREPMLWLLVLATWLSTVVTLAISVPKPIGGGKEPCMTFCKPTCPECGHPATHILEMVYLHTPIEFVTDVVAECREDESPEV